MSVSGVVVPIRGDLSVILEDLNTSCAFSTPLKGVPSVTMLVVDMMS